MEVDLDGTGDSTATLIEAQQPLVARLRDARADSPFGPRRRRASELASEMTGVRLGRVAPARAAEPLVATVRTPPPAPAMRRAGRPVRVRDPEHHRYDGTVSVSIGPFRDVDQIGDFAEALTAISGVGSVNVRTFDRSYVVFELDIVEPTALIAAFRRRSPRALTLLHANDRIIRLKMT